MAHFCFRQLYNDRNVIFELSRKNIKTQYRDSPIGLVWTVLNPLLNMLVMWLVFRIILNNNDPYYPLYILSGNILFAAIRTSTDQSLQSLVRNRGLLLRTKIEPYVFPMSNCISATVNFLFSLIALLPFMIYLSISQGLNLFTYRLVFILLMLPAFWMFEMGCGIFLCALFVFFRDTKHIYSVFLTLWTYLTPIFYVVKEGSPLLKIVNFNPMYHFVTYFRECVYSGATAACVPSWTRLLLLYGIGVLFLILGSLFFNALKKKIITRI